MILVDLKEIISNKAHESSLKGLKDVPPSLQEYMNLEFLNSVASSLSAITRDQFNYTGKIHQEGDSLRIVFTSSSQTDSIDMIIKYENAGFEFRNINQKLEKTLDLHVDSNDQASVEGDMEIDVEPQPEVEDEPMPIISVDVLTQVVDDDNREKTKKVADAMLSALTKMNVDQEFEKKSRMLDNMLGEDA